VDTAPLDEIGDLVKAYSRRGAESAAPAPPAAADAGGDDEQDWGTLLEQLGLFKLEAEYGKAGGREDVFMLSRRLMDERAGDAKLQEEIARFLTFYESESGGMD
jgi:hypothetical protein